MPPTLTPIKTFLGNYYHEILTASKLVKYSNTKLDTFFEQRFIVQSNDTQMVVDSSLHGLSIVVAGNEIRVSKGLFDNDNITITNSMENKNVAVSPKKLYTPEVFSTVAYLVCQNHTTFFITGDLDEPIYVKFTSDYETFYNSVIVFNIESGVMAEIVEEFESKCALNTVNNYVLGQAAKLSLTTFYKNNIAALSFCLRNVITMDDANYTHTVFGVGSSNIIDENRINPGEDASIEMLGCIDVEQWDFHSIVGVASDANYYFLLDYRGIVSDDGSMTFTPTVMPPTSHNAFSSVSSLPTDVITVDRRIPRITEFLRDIVERTTSEYSVGVERLYKNKSDFLQF